MDFVNVIPLYLSTRHIYHRYWYERHLTLGVCKKPDQPATRPEQPDPNSGSTQPNQHTCRVGLGLHFSG